MKLEWKAKTVFFLGRFSGMKPYHQLTPAEARKQEQLPRTFVTNLIMGRLVPLPRIENILITGRAGKVPGRVYWPAARPHLPLLVYYHGGGFATGSLDTHDNVCRRLALVTGRLVIAVAYRLAPEFPFPHGVEDSYDALVWIANHAHEFGGNRRQLAVAGDSAGGNLAAVMCQLSRDRWGPSIQKQVLIYPAVDATRAYPSEVIYAETPILSQKDVQAFRGYYLRCEEDTFDPRCSPLLGRLERLPPAFILTAEYDPLRDHGYVYADALTAAGVQTRLELYPRQIHGFVNFPPLASQAGRAFADIAEFLEN